jgi:hypothetical protein
MEIWGGEGEDEVDERIKMERKRGRRRDQPSLSPPMKVLLLELGRRRWTLDKG